MLLIGKQKKTHNHFSVPTNCIPYRHTSAAEQHTLWLLSKPYYTQSQTATLRLCNDCVVRIKNWEQFEFRGLGNMTGSSHVTWLSQSLLDCHFPGLAKLSIYGSGST